MSQTNPCSLTIDQQAQLEVMRVIASKMTDDELKEKISEFHSRLIAIDNHYKAKIKKQWKL